MVDAHCRSSAVSNSSSFNIVFTGFAFGEQTVSFLIAIIHLQLSVNKWFSSHLFKNK